MDEKRKETRKKVMAFTPVYYLEWERRVLLGYLGDLTLQGALVVGEKTQEVNRQLALVVEFPDSLPGIPVTRLTIPARVARCVKDEGPQDYDIGVEFLEVSLENARIIEALLERYHFRHKI
jgi:hypothetical protein